MTARPRSVSRGKFQAVVLTLFKRGHTLLNVRKMRRFENDFIRCVWIKAAAGRFCRFVLEHVYAAPGVPDDGAADPPPHLQQIKEPRPRAEADYCNGSRFHLLIFLTAAWLHLHVSEIQLYLGRLLKGTGGILGCQSYRRLA